MFFHAVTHVEQANISQQKTYTVFVKPYKKIIQIRWVPH